MCSIAASRSGTTAAAMSSARYSLAQSSSVASTLQPAGLENSIGVIVGTMIMDPNDSKWASSDGVRQYRAFFEKYLAGSDFGNATYLTGYQQGMILEQILKQCGNDLSRENIMKQAANVKNFELPLLLPGIKVNTSPTDFAPIEQEQLAKFDGEKWSLFGEVIEAVRKQ